MFLGVSLVVWRMGDGQLFHAIDDRGRVGVDGFQLRSEGLGGFGAIADGDQVADGRAELVPGDDFILGRRRLRQQVLE